MQKDFIDFLKESISIVDVVSRKIKLRRVGHDLFGVCPFHNEKTGSLKVDPEKGLYYCFGCGAHGDIFTFIMESERIDFKGAVEFLANAYGFKIPKSAAALDKNHEIYKLVDIIKRWFIDTLNSPKGEAAHQYLNSRAISKEMIKNFELGFCPEGRDLQNYLFKLGFSEDLLLKTGVFFKSDGKPIYNRYYKRLIFPILDARGRCVGFGGRILTPQEGVAKYINSPESDIYVKNENLYGYHIAKNSSLKEIMIVEGYLDVISLHQAGFTSAVAPLGTAISPSQIEMSWKVCDAPYIALDGDVAGKKASYRWLEKILPLLRAGKTFKFVHFPLGQDPDEMIRAGKGEEIRFLMNKALNLVDWLWEGALEFNSFDTPEEKANIIKMLLEKVDLIKDEVVKKFYIYEIRERQKLFYKRTFRPQQAPSISLMEPAQKKREKFLVAILLNHPYIVINVIERLVELNFSDSKMEKLRGLIIAAYNNYYVQMDKEGYNKEIEKIKNTTTDIFDNVVFKISFACENVSDETAQNAWLAVLDEYFASLNGREDLQAAAISLKSTFSHNDWQRLKALKKEFLLRKKGPEKYTG